MVVPGPKGGVSVTPATDNTASVASLPAVGAVASSLAQLTSGAALKNPNALRA